MLVKAACYGLLVMCGLCVGAVAEDRLPMQPTVDLEAVPPAPQMDAPQQPAPFTQPYVVPQYYYYYGPYGYPRPGYEYQFNRYEARSASGYTRLFSL